MKKLILMLILLFCTVTHAATIAVIDSGVDYKHKALSGKIWTNPTPGNAGYADDTYGWNFAENNNQVIDYSYLGTFSKDPYTFFVIQYKSFIGTITEEEKQWVKQKKSDDNFMKELEKFANFVHGTHVAGISSKDSDGARIMALKIIPTEVKQPFQKFMERHRYLEGMFDGTSNPLMEMALDFLAQQQAGLLDNIGKYVNTEKASVANCSFGSSVAAVKPIIAQLIKQFTGKDPTDQELDEYAKYFIGRVIEHGKVLITDAPNTMFVIAAGNDRADNDVVPVFPSNVKEANTISVAATFGVDKIASFSNYGQKMVDIAAPGVGILSSIPGDEYLMVSGTSQATPFVGNVVNRIIDTNPKLSFSDVKAILFGTVDKKDFLVGKVATAGIANPLRAVRAAELSLTLSVSDAIGQATRIPDLVVVMPKSEGEYIMPLLNMFQ